MDRARGVLCGGGNCKGGLVLCNGVCVDLQTDNGNCGQCGNACQKGAVCANGMCGMCQQGLQACNGICVNTSSDPANCGACGNVCPQGVMCVNGVCNMVQPCPPCLNGTVCCMKTGKCYNPACLACCM